MRGIAFLALVALLGANPAAAQTPPDPAEIAQYRGLHRAAARGDAGEIARLLAGGADANARDGRGRSALHVAIFGGHADAARALVRGGADPRAMENQRYDIVTIAAVAGDRPKQLRAVGRGGGPRRGPPPQHS
ncbi:MAG: ankyrin repeat domain-containing protein, partial [Rhodospirillales bacterium]